MAVLLPKFLFQSPSEALSLCRDFLGRAGAKFDLLPSPFSSVASLDIHDTHPLNVGYVPIGVLLT